MNEQDQEPILDPNAPASSPGSQPSGAPASMPPSTYGGWRGQRHIAGPEDTVDRIFDHDPGPNSVSEETIKTTGVILVGRR